MLYNTNINLTYKKFPDDESDTIYRKELVKVFDLDEFDLDMINSKVEKLYNKLLFDENMKNRLKENAGKMLSEDLILGFMICFSYDQFTETHDFICNMLQQNSNRTLTI